MSRTLDSSHDYLLDKIPVQDPVSECNNRLINSLYPPNVRSPGLRLAFETGNSGDSTKLEEHHRLEGSSWFSRTFSPITPGSLRGSTFTLISTALGAGILSLPKMYSNTGLILGTIFLVLAGLAALWSMYLLSKCSFRTHTNRYSDAMLQLLGKKWNLFLQIVLIISVLGTLVSYMITLNQFIGSIAGNFGIVSHDDAKNWSDPNSDQYYHSYIIISIIAILSYPLSCIKNLSGLRYLTIFSVGAICYIIITIVWQAPILHSRLAPDSDIVWAKVSWNSLTGWAICAFAFTCHINVFPVISELQFASQKRTTKIFNRCITVEVIMYLSAGLGGYLSMLNNTPGNFVTRNAEVGPHDIFMTIAQIAMALNLFLVMPVNVNPCRLQILILFGKEKNPSNLVYYGLTALLLVGCAGIAMIFPNIYSAFAILGGFFATMVTYTFPSMIYLKCTKMREGHYKKTLVYIIATVTTVMGFASGFVTLFQTFGVLPSS